VEIVQHKLQDFGYLCISDLYTKKELGSIKNEIKNLNYIMDTVPDVQKKRDATSDKNEDGSPKMTGNGIPIDNLYSTRAYSAILSFNRKIFVDPIASKMAETHPSNVAFKRLNDDYSLLNRYSSGDEYLTHFDVSSFSAVTFFSVGRNKVLGGELVFSDYDISFKFKDNFCIIFPSWVEHHANKVKSKNTYRYSLSQFGVIEYHRS